MSTIEKQFYDVVRAHRWPDVLRMVAVHHAEISLYKEKSLLLREAAKTNQHELLVILMEDYDMELTAGDLMALRWAAAMGHRAVAKLIVQTYYDCEDLLSLLVAVVQNHLEIVEVLLKNGVWHVEASNSDVTTRSDKELAKVLMPSGAWPYVGDGAALVIAAIMGHLEIVKLLLAHLREHANDSFQRIATITLQHAAKHGRLEMVEFLLTMGDACNPEADKNLAACEAAQNGHVSVLKVLLADERVAKTDFRDDILLESAKKGLHEVVNLILGRRDVLKMKMNAHLALCDALQNGHIETARLLIMDSRTNCVLTNNLPIRLAAKRGYTEIVKVLLSDETGADPAALMNYAISAACTGGHLDVVKLLLNDQRVDPAAIENYPLHCAIRRGHESVVKLLLLDARVHPAARNNEGVRLAAELGHAEVLKLLLADARVDPAADGNVAIRAAAAAGRAECVRLLLSDARVDPAANGNEAVGECAKMGHTECLQLFLADARIDPAAQENVAVKDAAVGGHIDALKLLLADARIDPTTNNNSALIEALMISQDAAAECLINDQRVRDSLNEKFIPSAVSDTETAKKIEKFLMSHRIVLSNKRLKVFLDQECCICHCDFRANPPVVVGQCGHMTCEPCGARIDRCPVCREPCVDFTK